MTQNNRDLFNNLHQQYHSMVLQICRGFVKGDIDLANDLSQDVFINIWNALHKFRGASSYKTWIYRIAANTCLKYFRDRKKPDNLSLDEIGIRATDEDDHKEVENKMLYNAIGQLVEIDRLIIMMVLDELKHEEIASIIGISPSNVRVKIHRIKKQLKTILGNERSN